MAELDVFEGVFCMKDMCPGFEAVIVKVVVELEIGWC